MREINNCFFDPYAFPQPKVQVTSLRRHLDVARYAAANRQLAVCRKAKTPLAIWWRVAEDVTCEEVLEFFHEFNRKSLFSHEFR